MIGELGIQIRSVLEVTLAINSGYFKNGATPGDDSIVGTNVAFLGCPGTVEELAESVTFSVDGSLLTIRILEPLSWSVKGTAVLFHFQNSSSLTELERLDLTD